MCMQALANPLALYAVAVAIAGDTSLFTCTELLTPRLHSALRLVQHAACHLAVQLHV